MPTARVKTPLVIRLDDDIRAALERLAQRDTRSLSGMVQKLIRDEALRSGAMTVPNAVPKTAKR